MNFNNLNKNNKAHVLITGGCGFIGSHIVKNLIMLGIEKITVIDSLKYGSINNITDILDKITFVQSTLGHEISSQLETIFKNVDYVIHLAAEKHNQSKDSPHILFDSNINGTYNVLKLAAQNHVKKIVFSSSLYVYGRKSLPPYVESEALFPTTPYGISKLCGEHFCRFFSAQYGLKFTILRYLFAYGPNQFAQMGYKSVIVKNFERILRNENPIVFGDGQQALDYIYVEDVARMTIQCLFDDQTNNVLNVGSGKPITVNELTDKMINISGKPLVKQFGLKDETHNSIRVANTDRLTQYGFNPQVELEEGLKRTYSWMQKKQQTQHTS